MLTSLTLSDLDFDYTHHLVRAELGGFAPLPFSRFVAIAMECFGFTVEVAR